MQSIYHTAELYIIAKPLPCFVLESHAYNFKEPLNQSSAALSGSFAPAYRFENLEIHKVFLQFPNLNLVQNPSLTTLAI